MGEQLLPIGGQINYHAYKGEDKHIGCWSPGNLRPDKGDNRKKVHADSFDTNPDRQRPMVIETR